MKTISPWELLRTAKKSETFPEIGDRCREIKTKMLGFMMPSTCGNLFCFRGDDGKIYGPSDIINLEIVKTEKYFDEKEKQLFEEANKHVFEVYKRNLTRELPMDAKRYEDIKWEFENDRAKFNLHAAEYFEEAMPILEQLLTKKESKKEEKKHK